MKQFAHALILSAVGIFLLGLILLCFPFRGCLISENAALDLVKKTGFTEAKVLDKSLFFIRARGCGSEDSALFEIRAINPIGNAVTIKVCVGWPFKGATIVGN